MEKYKVPGYGNWRSMQKRCNQPTHDKYADYGGRGIAVCARWSSFDAFIEDMGPRPSPLHTIERRDVNGNYEPSNCQWATHSEQMRNIRTNIKLMLNGIEVLLVDECKARGLPYQTAYMRLRRGMTPEQALNVNHYQHSAWRTTEPRVSNACGLRGVSRKRDRWRAVIAIDGKQHYLGSYDTREEAHQAYLKAHGERREILGAGERRKEKAT